MGVEPMPTYLFRLIADSWVRLSETPYIDNTLFPFTLTLKGQFVVTIVDNTILLGNLHIPKGLVINAQVDAPDITSAIDYAGGAATYVLSMLSCVCNASILQPIPLWGYDATPGLTKRDIVVFAYDTNLNIKTRPLQKVNWSALLEAKFNGFMLKNEIADDLKRRMQRAVVAFRRGLADTADTLDEFLVHWSSLETLDVVYRTVFTHNDLHHYTTCGSCKTEFKHCPVCGNSGVFRNPQRHTGVEDVFKHLQQPEKYNQLKRLRNGISHGYMSLSECEETAGENIELVRKAVLTMILRILGLEADIQALILANKCIKGKSVPTFRFYGKGTFEPGDPSRYDTHPYVEVKCTNLKVNKTDNMVILHPTWEFTNTNFPISDIVAELWADENVGLTVTDDMTFLQKEPDTQSGASG
jgi:hypothetical protein